MPDGESFPRRTSSPTEAMATTSAIFLLALTGLLMCLAAGEECSTEHASACYNSLVHYEGLGFPLYGETEQELDETCGHINHYFECAEKFIVCRNHTNCDKECEEMIDDIEIFVAQTQLRELQSDLCDVLSPMRQSYLENYLCLEDLADEYTACHNDSQKSQEYMAHITDSKESLLAKCCFFSWYQDCFTNITRDSCSVNATVFVSVSLHKLIGRTADVICHDTPVVCSSPPSEKDGKVVATTQETSTEDHSSASHLLISFLLVLLSISVHFSLQ
ncbi:uncharacterized protein CDAR_82151 [Caerostris darwini]|uniref:Secreted protein n=1 Tax=Caerostris darwini TaxID=1538125 RepID=A0AAV4VHR0_9ARAC|nr:uncharacterized protein CDAR_82151 [Caerostris darwini]